MLLACVVVAVVAATRPNPFGDDQVVWAKFEHVNGLGAIDRDIRVAGVNQGEIGDVKRVGDDALVELVLDEEIAVHADAHVALRPHTLFEGSAFIDLHPGSPSAPPIEPAAMIERDRTGVYVPLDEAIRVFDESAREDLRDLIAAAGEATGGESVKALQRTLRASPELTEELGPTARALQGPEGVELAGAIDGAARTVEALALRESSLAPLAERANRTLAGLDLEGGAALERALAAVPGPLERLRANGPELVALVDRIDALAVELRPALDELAPTLDALQPLLVKATPPIRRAVPLVSAIGTVLERATVAAPSLVELLVKLRPSGRRLENEILPTLTRKSRLGLPAYMQLISGFAGGTSALRAYQTEAQGGLGAGHVLRLGAYFDPTGSLGLAGGLPCDAIVALNPNLAAALAAAGLCAP
jgi:ABC-type transporter Mla subunit MlaD